MGTFAHADEQKNVKDKECLVTESIVQAVKYGIRLNYSIDQLQVKTGSATVDPRFNSLNYRFPLM
jgi:hypothetical protein